MACEVVLSVARAMPVITWLNMYLHPANTGFAYARGGLITVGYHSPSFLRRCLVSCMAILGFALHVATFLHDQAQGKVDVDRDSQSCQRCRI